MQGRIKALNDGGRPVRDYFLSKAQCWLDVSFHEYTRNDRSAFPQAALSESEKLVVGMEQGASPLPLDTPLVNGAARLRPDLWDRAAALRGHAGWRCAAQKTACAEVELVHAGHEINQQQWRHAKPTCRSRKTCWARRRRWRRTATRRRPHRRPWRCRAHPRRRHPCSCRRRAAGDAELQLSAGVSNFDQHVASQMRPFSVVQLEELVRRVRRERRGAGGAPERPRRPPQQHRPGRLQPAPERKGAWPP